MTDRFMKYVDKQPSGCWLWTGTQSNHSKHGQFAIPTKVTTEEGTRLTVYRMRGAHIISHELFIGPVPEGFEVVRTCFNRLCVSPEHVRAVTHQGRQDLVVEAGRQPKGEGHGGARLTEKDVLEIRRSSTVAGKLGKLFGVSRQHITRIKNRSCWKHI